MPGAYSKIKTVISGETITATDRNAEHDNHINNCDFVGLGDYSDNVTQMRATTDPYPSGVESLATDGKGELERFRYLMVQVTGKTYWYQDPSSSIEAIVNGTQTFAGSKTFSSAVFFPQGTNSLPGIAAGSYNTGIAGSAASMGLIANSVLGLTLSNTASVVTVIVEAGPLIIAPTSNQLVLGAVRTVTIHAPTPASASRIWTIPDITGAGTFAALEGTQTFSGSKTFSAGLTLSATTNQLVLGVTNTTTITSPAPSGSRTYTIPDAGGAASFVMTALAQTIGGAKTFSSPVITPVGAVGAPGLQLGAAADGLFVTGSGATTSINMACRGVNVMSSNSTGIFVQQILNVAGVGSVGAPAISIGAAADGMYVGGSGATTSLNLVCRGIAVFGTNSVGITQLTTQFSGDITPQTTNTGSCGTAALKWALVRATTITPGDLLFENDWVITEGDKVGMPHEGLIMVSPTGERYTFCLTKVTDAGSKFKRKWVMREGAPTN